MPANADEWRWVLGKMKAALAAAQAKRDQSADWIRFEQRSMLDAVNLERGARALPPIDLATLERAEAMAVGHTDYSDKFALYCTELVWKVPP